MKDWANLFLSIHQHGNGSRANQAFCFELLCYFLACILSCLEFPQLYLHYTYYLGFLKIPPAQEECNVKVNLVTQHICKLLHNGSVSLCTLWTRLQLLPTGLCTSTSLLMYSSWKGLTGILFLCSVSFALSVLPHMFFIVCYFFVLNNSLDKKGSSPCLVWVHQHPYAYARLS